MTPAAARAAVRRVGRRGAVLTCKGLMAALYGWGQVVDPPTTSSVRLLTSVMPQRCWGWVWICAGVTALACVPLRQGRDWPGFAAIYLMASLWAGAQATGWWLYDNPRGWVGGIVFAAWGGVAAVIADWPEPVRLPDRRGP